MESGEKRFREVKDGRTEWFSAKLLLPKQEAAARERDNDKRTKFEID